MGNAKVFVSFSLNVRAGLASFSFLGEDEISLVAEAVPLTLCITSLRCPRVKEGRGRGHTSQRFFTHVIDLI